MINRINKTEVLAIYDKHPNAEINNVKANEFATSILNQVYDHMKSTAEKGQNNFLFSHTYGTSGDIDLKRVKEMVVSYLSHDGFCCKFDITGSYFKIVVDI